MINEAHGGTVIAAWEVDQLPDTWIDAFQAIRLDFPEIQEHFNKLERDRDEWRKKHKYRM